MKVLNIPCEKFSVIMESSPVDQRDQWVEVIVATEESNVINQFTAKEIVECFDCGSLLDEIGMLIALEHFARPGGVSMQDFRDILDRAKGESK